MRALSTRERFVAKFGEEEAESYEPSKAGAFEQAIRETSREAASRQAAVEAYIARYLADTGSRIEDLMLALKDGKWWLERKTVVQEFECGGGI